jgi:hypothetical protein
LWETAYREAIAGDAVPALDERYAPSVRLDGGASAAVWQAYDRKLGRNVAIKLFHAGRAHAAALAEARAACDVISDHVVRVLDVHAGDRPYIVMELVGEHDPVRGEQVPGASAAVVRPRSVDEAVRWVRDCARGVHDAHLRDVFHRDLKPANVLVTPVSRRARIGDFGLAASESRLAGTPEYMAPEQAIPRRVARERNALVAIDVWGLGALAYDLIGGRAPWAAAGREGEGIDAWERAARGSPPPPLPDAPPRLRRVIEKAMAIDPSARYATAGALGDELDAYLAQRPTSLDRSRVLRAALFCRRNPQLSLTAAAATVLAGLTLAAYVAVVELRGRARSLADEVVAEESSNRQLEARIAKTRDELAKTEADLKSRGQILASLERALEEEQTSLHAIVAARDKALVSADATTRALADQLTVARSDRAAAELGRTMYEGFWTSARKDRDRLQADLDKLRAELARVRSEVARLSAAAPAPPDAGVADAPSD